MKIDIDWVLPFLVPAIAYLIVAFVFTKMEVPDWRMQNCIYMLKDAANCEIVKDWMKK